MPRLQSPVRARRWMLAAALLIAPACRDEAVAPLAEESSASAHALALVRNVRGDGDIMGLLHLTNLAVMQTGAVALQRAVATPVYAYASSMIAAYGEIDRRGARVSWEILVAPTLPDSTLPRLHTEDAALLAAASRADFDSVYVALQLQVHERTLALIDAARPRVERGELGVLLDAVVRPAVAAHHRAAVALHRQLAGR